MSEPKLCNKHQIPLQVMFGDCGCDGGVTEGEWDEPHWVKCFRCDGTGEIEFIGCEICEEEEYD